MNKTAVNKQTPPAQSVMESPRDALIYFLKNATLGEDFTVHFVAADADEARRFVHNMRCVLSRLRSDAMQMGKRRKAFKIRTISIDELEHGSYAVVWNKTVSRIAPLDDGILDHIALD